MNKIININLGGVAFTIDDDAFDALKNYLADLKRVFASSEGRDEIVADIEARCAELIQQNLGTKPIVSIREVDAAIAVLGRPEQLDGADASAASTEKSSSSSGSSRGHSSRYATGKRLFRDDEDAVVAGVCSGLAQYLGIGDPLWVRLFFVLMSFTFGSALILYAILWAVLPKVASTADRLALRGEPINAENIAREVEEGFDRLSRRVTDLGDEAKKKSHDFASAASQTASRARVRGAVSEGVSSVGRLFAFAARVVFAFFKILFWFVLACLVLALLGSWIGLVWAFAWGKPLIDYVSPFSSGSSLFVLFLGFLACAVPLFLMILSFSKNVFRSRTSAWMRPAAFGTWIFSLVGLFLMGIFGAKKFSQPGFVTRSADLSAVSADTLRIEALHDDGLSANWNSRTHWGFDDDHDWDNANDFFRIYDEKLTAGLPLRLKVKSTAGDRFELQQTFRAQGESSREATDLASKISYPLRVEAGKLILPSFIEIPKGEKWRVQRAEFTLFVPVGKHVAFGKWVNDCVRDSEIEGAHGSWVFDNPDRVFRMGEKGLACVDCPDRDRWDSRRDRHSHFREITITGNLDVQIEKSAWEDRSVKVEGGDAIEKGVKVRIENGKLTLINDLPGGRAATVRVKTEDLESLFAENFGAVSVRGFDENNVKMTLLNGKKVSVFADANEMTVQILGKTDVKLIGEGRELKATIGEGATLDAAGYRSEIASVAATGGASATVNAENRFEKSAAEGSVVRNLGAAKAEKTEAEQE